MPGFNFSYNTSINLELQDNSELLRQKMVGENYELNRFTLNKFLEDKIFEDTDEYIIVLEGVILNRTTLLEEFSSDSWSDLIWKLYQKDQEFFNVLRGSFSGLIYDKKNNVWFVFTDHLGTKHIYYFIEDSKLIVSSEIKDLYNYFKMNNIEYTLSNDSAYALLSYGYMLEDNTLCAKIKKLLPGHYLKINNHSFETLQYYELPLASTQTSLSEAEIIDNLDEKFREAIKLQFDKDREYGYKHLVALSGGLDSRMTSWVAHEMGYNNQLNFTFSQSDYLDETIPKKITADLKHEWIFKALDNGLFLKDIDEVNLMTGSNVLYYGLAHGNSLFKLMNFENLGISHSGQLGDVIIGSFINNFSKKNLLKLSGAYSKTLLKDSDSINEYKSPEHLERILLYRRGLNGANNGLISTQKYTEIMSPFYDIEFFEYCLSIPIKLRMNHYIYKRWILDKYPKASNYVWEKTQLKINKGSLEIKYKNRSIPCVRIPRWVLTKLGLIKLGSHTKKHMNPLDYWYSTNKDIANFQDDYYHTNINLILDAKLKIDCIKLYENGNAIEKNQVLTLLSGMKLFYN